MPAYAFRKQRLSETWNLILPCLHKQMDDLHSDQWKEQWVFSEVPDFNDQDGIKTKQNKKKRRISLFASAKVVLLGQSYSFTDESRHREVRTKCKSSFTKGKNERLNWEMKSTDQIKLRSLFLTTGQVLDKTNDKTIILSDFSK